MSPRVIKTYCYCIRQILAWILIDREGEINAPINIDELLNIFQEKHYDVGDGILNDMRDLIEFYKSNCKSNKFTERQKLNLDEFIKTWLYVMKTKQGKESELPDIEIYNERFRKLVFLNNIDMEMKNLVNRKCFFY